MPNKPAPAPDVPVPDDVTTVTWTDFTLVAGAQSYVVSLTTTAEGINARVQDLYNGYTSMELAGFEPRVSVEERSICQYIVLKSSQVGHWVQKHTTNEGVDYYS